MRAAITDQRLEDGRIRSGHYASNPGDLHGAFLIPSPYGTELKIMSSGTGHDADGWEHVSISTPRRTPNWAEMCMVKNLFWGEEECVVQFHPPKSDYVNHHPHCLHQWKWLGGNFPTPPTYMVGPK